MRIRRQHSTLALILPVLGGLLASCATSDAAIELAKETQSVVGQLDRDGKTIVAADARTERLRAKLLGSRRQRADQGSQKRQIEHRAGTAAKAQTDLILADVEKIAGDHSAFLRAHDNSAYNPDALLTGYPDRASPFGPLADVRKALKKLEKELSFIERAKIYGAFAVEVGKSIKDAAKKSEEAAGDAEGTLNSVP